MSETLQSEQINELATALAEAQYSLEGARKDSNNPFFKSKYADLEACVGALRDPLHENGLSYSQTTRVTEQGTVLVTTLMHKSGQWIKGELPLSAKEANNPQAQGSAISYARRYALSAITGLVQVDDDGEAALGRQPAKKQETPKANPYTPKPAASKPTTTTAKPAATASQPSQPAPTKSGIVEGEEPEPTDAQVVAEAKVPGPEVFKQFQDAGVSNGWTVAQVENWTEKFLADNGIDPDSAETLTAIANQMSWAMVEGGVNYLLNNKP